MAGKKDRRFRKNYRFISMVVVFLCGGVLINSHSLRQTRMQQKTELELLKKNIAQEQKKREALKEKQADLNSKDFIEREAREKLGLAYPDEILFFSETE